VLIKRLRLHLVGLSILLLSGASYGNDEQGLFRVRGIGASTCGKYVEAIDHSDASVKAENDRYAFLSWVGGYLSHYNHQSDGVYDIFGYTDMPAIQLWLYNYCRRSPLNAFDQGVEALIIDLYPSRLSRAPR
jgi:hypothetical protein